MYKCRTWVCVDFDSNMFQRACALWKCQHGQSVMELGTDGFPVIPGSFHSLTLDKAHRERERVAWIS